MGEPYTEARRTAERAQAIEESYIRVVRSLDKEYGKDGWETRSRGWAAGQVNCVGVRLQVHNTDCEHDPYATCRCLNREALSSVGVIDDDWETARRSALVNAYHEMFEIS
jgi:hypothetical protein